MRKISVYGMEFTERAAKQGAKLLLRFSKVLHYQGAMEFEITSLDVIEELGRLGYSQKSSKYGDITIWGK